MFTAPEADFLACRMPIVHVPYPYLYPQRISEADQFMQAAKGIPVKGQT